MLLRLIPLSFVLLANSCESPGIVQVSPGSYMISKTSAAGGFANMSKLKTEVIREANNFAQSQRGVVIPGEIEENRPSVGFPTVTFNFGVTTPEAYNKMAARSERDWAALSSSQRVALQQKSLDRQPFAQQSAMDRNAYNARSAVMAMPQKVNHLVSVTGNMHHSVDVEGQIFVRPKY